MSDTKLNRGEKPTVLVAGRYPELELSLLENVYAVLRLWETSDEASMISRHSHDIRALIARSDIGVSSEIIRSLPNLEIIACFGAGTDAIDVDLARKNGIKVVNTPDVASGDVADAAIALCLAVARKIPASDAHVRNGAWQLAPFPLTTRFFGKRLGIVGLGRIGMAIAKRAEAFDMQISYHNRSARNDVPYPYCASVEELAGRSDFLVASLSGGEANNAVIGAREFAALGAGGFFINVSRGAVVDEAALLQALEKKNIGGAGLDVFCNEPEINSRFLRLKTVVLQPHSASSTKETRAAMGKLVRDNLALHFDGKPLLTPL